MLNWWSAELKNCGFVFIGDIAASQVESYLADLRREGSSIQTSNHYLRAIKQFMRWLVLNRRASDNPLAHLSTLNTETDRRRRRRPLTPQEFEKLIQSAETGPVVCRLSGTDRAVLYIISAYTGYRRNEIASVTPRSFDFESNPPTLAVQAGHSKRRHADVVPLRKDFADRIREWIESKENLDPNKPLFRIGKNRTAEMIKADLERAGIPYVDEQGRYADFHALRHTFVSNLGKAGVSPKTAQSLARHSDINLTMNVYTHLELQDQLQALEGLPPLPKASPKNGGPEGQRGSTGRGGKTEKVVPKMVPNGFRRKKRGSHRMAQRSRFRRRRMTPRMESISHWEKRRLATDVTASQRLTGMKKSGEGGIRSSQFPQLLIRPLFAAQPLSLKKVTFLGLLLVIGGCWGLIGIGFSTLSAHPQPPESKALPAPSGRSSRRRVHARNDESGGDGDGWVGEIAASYSRFSSELQSSESIGTQQQKCRDRAIQDGRQIFPELEFTDEAVSGTILHRAGLDRMLEAAAAGEFQVLYFNNLSRLARESVITMPMLERLVYVHKVRVISVTEGIDSAREGWDLMATILSIQHERYIKDLSDNVFRGQEGALLAGYSVGDYCFGYTSVPVPGSEQARRGRNAKPRMVYAVDPETATWVARIFHWFVYERKSLRWITRELNRLRAPKDHRSTTKSWHHQYLPGLLSKKKYVGIWPWGEKKNVRNPLTGQVKQEDRPEEETEKWTRPIPELQIVDSETFEAAQEFLKQNARTYGAKRGARGRLRGSVVDTAHPRHLLSGLIYCAACGATFYVGGAHGKYLFCPNYTKGNCRCRTQLRRDRAERMILDEIGRRILANSEWKQSVFDHLQKAWSEQEEKVPAELAAAESKLKDVERKIARLLDRIEDGLDDPELRDRLAQRRQEKRDLVRTVEKLRNKDQHRGPAPTAEWVEQQLEQLGTVLQGDVPAAALALRELVGGRILVTEIRHEDRQRHYLQGRFTLCSKKVGQAIAGETSSEEGRPDGDSFTEEIIIDFVEPDLIVAQSEEAKELYDQGLMNKEIARELGHKKSYVTKLLKYWFESRGQTMPDGRARRSQLKKKHTEPPLYQRIADQVKELADQGLLFDEIAQRLECDRNTVTQAWRYWHTVRSLEVPDGRTRRKNLKRKSSSGRKRSQDDPPESDASAA